MDNNFSQEQINTIIQQYKDNISINVIMDNFNSNEHNIREILKQYQIDRVYNNWTDELTNRVIELHQNNFLHKEIEYMLLVSSVGINKVLDRNNIPRMDYTQRNRRFNRDSNYFDIIDTPNKAYFLGLLCSDGHNNTSNHQIIIDLQEEDGYLIEQFKEAIKYEGSIKINNRNHMLNSKHKISKRLCIEDIHMSEQLLNIGMMQQKSLNFKFPTCIPENLIRHFLRGYFDGDGTIYFDNKYLKGSAKLVGTFEFCQEVSQLLLSKGIKNNIHYPKQSRELNSNTYVVQTCGNVSTYKFLSWMYDDADIKMVRKYERYLKVRERYCELHAI